MIPTRVYHYVHLVPKDFDFGDRCPGMRRFCQGERKLLHQRPESNSQIFQNPLVKVYTLIPNKDP